MTSLENNRRPKFLKNPNQPFNERRIGQLSPNELDDLTHGTGNPAFDPIEAERRRHQAFLESAGANRPEQKENKSRYSRKTKVIASLSAVAAAATVAGVGGYGYMKFNDKASEVAGNQVANYLLSDTDGSSNDVNLEEGILLAPDNSSRNEQIQYALTELERVEDKSISALEAEGHSVDIGNGDENDTPQQIVDRFAVNSYSVWSIGKESPEKVRQVTAGFIDPSIEQYDQTVEMSTDGGAMIDSTATVIDASHVFKKTSFQDIPSNGKATRIITFQFNGSGKLNQAVFQQVEGVDEDEQNWVLKKLTYAHGGGNDFITDIATETKDFSQQLTHFTWLLLQDTDCCILYLYNHEQYKKYFW